MSRKIIIDQTGGPEVLTLTESPPPEIKPNEVRVRHRAIGVNFIDTYHRSGLYPMSLPAGIGVEAAGEIEAVGDAAFGWEIGARVAYICQRPGAYSDHGVVAGDRLIRLPEEISFEQAAASLLKGMTAEFLLMRCAPVSHGDALLIHAAAGGVGQILCQWAVALGARVIATAGSENKLETVRTFGPIAAINYRTTDFVTEVKSLTAGQGVRAAFDGVGADTALKSLQCVARRGHLVLFGNASGPVAPIDPLLLSRQGSVFLTRPTLFDYTATPEDLALSAQALFARLSDGSVKLSSGETLPLEQAAEAHRRLESGKTSGSMLLIP